MTLYKNTCVSISIVIVYMGKHLWSFKNVDRNITNPEEIEYEFAYVKSRKVFSPTEPIDVIKKIIA